MKKILLTKSNNSLNGQKPLVLENNNKHLYLKRKAMQSAYQELFQALLRLPDRQVQARVLEAINDTTKLITAKEEGKELCYNCLKKETYNNLVDASTQTTFLDSKTIVSSLNDSRNSILTIRDDSLDDLKTIPTEEIDNANETAKKKILEDLPVAKRKHRRKVRLPQVIKKSQAKQMQQKQPKLQKRKVEVVKAKNDELEDDRDFAQKKLRRSLSISSVEVEEGISLSQCLEDMDSNAFVKETIIQEFEKSERIQADGLIPIHGAIMNNDYIGLKFQIYVWQKLKHVDLNDIYTEEDEDCLQLAVTENKSYEIVNVLINSGLNLNSFDTKSNTIIHLAILNEVDVEILSLLMEKINLDMLLKFNDDGFTPLHLAVRQDSFLLAEKILNILDKRSFNCVNYEREQKKSDTKDLFLSFYEKQCDILSLKRSMIQSKEKQLLKRRLIDAGEMRSGNTALFYAIENKLEHSIYFLLAHFADPRVENHSGQTSRSYLCEFAKVLNLSLKIDRVMEKVENLLKD